MNTGKASARATAAQKAAARAIAFVLACALVLGGGAGLSLPKAYAADATALIATINAVTGLTATPDAASPNTTTVTVAGSATLSHDTALSLVIPAGVKVLWKAELAGNTTSATSSLVQLSGGGSFEIVEGKIEQTGTGMAIYTADDNFKEITVSGGTTKAGANAAIFSMSDGCEVIVSGGTVTSAAGTGSRTLTATNKITICGDGKVENTGTAQGATVEAAATLIVKDNALITSAYRFAIYDALRVSTVIVEGGTIKAAGSSGLAINCVNSHSTVIVKGGVIEGENTGIWTYGTAAITGGSVKGGNNAISATDRTYLGEDSSAVAYLAGTVVSGDLMVLNDNTIVEASTLNVPLVWGNTSEGLTVKAGTGSAKWDTSAGIGNPAKIVFSLLDGTSRIIEWGTIMGNSAITINTQPLSTNVTQGKITESLAVSAQVTHGATLSYQWYSNTSPSNSGGVAIPGATGASYALSASLGAGEHYYYCVVNATGGATPVASAVATVTVSQVEVPLGSFPITVQNDGNGAAYSDVTSARAGTAVTLTAAPKSGYRFKEWQVVSGGVNIVNNRFTMPSQNVTVKAVFEAIPALAFTLTVVGGTDITNAGPYSPGAVVTIVSDDPKPGSAFDKWVLGGGGVLADAKSATTTITMPSANVTATATYKALASSANVTKIATPRTSIWVQSGKSFTIPAVAYEGKAVSKGKLVWESSNKKVTVSQKGVVSVPKSMKSGKATITAKAENGRTLKVTVNVSQKAVALNKATVSGLKDMKKGTTKKIGVKPSPAKATGVKVTFKSSNSKVVSVDAAGTLSAKKKGTATITVKAGKATVKKTIKVT